MASGFGKPYMVEGREELSAFHMTAMLVSVTEQQVGLQERNHGVTRLHWMTFRIEKTVVVVACVLYHGIFLLFGRDVIVIFIPTSTSSKSWEKV